MRIVRTVAELRAALRVTRQEGGRIGLVPTMGALHEGHLSLVTAAREASDLVVVSVFVNPTQFDDPDDLTAYPRDEERDAGLAAGAGADLLFAPTVEEMYPDGYATTVHVTGVSEPLEGAHRGASHFDGVATVVTKLFVAVAPDAAWFGQKDAQQVAVVRRVVTDLGLPLTIEVGPTVREDDGLAMSSRNVRLSADDRRRALALKSGLDVIAQALRAGADRGAAEQLGAQWMGLKGVEPDYLTVVDPTTFATASDETIAAGGPALAVVAAQVGPVRLIDNLPIASLTPVEETR